MAQRSLRQQPEQQAAPHGPGSVVLSHGPRTVVSASSVRVLRAWRGAGCLEGCWVPGGVLRAWREAFG